jgi:glycosyltransferase involved in cell wall biosynthesis
MKIAVNALALKMGGGATYVRELLPRLASLKEEHQFIVFLTTKNRAEFQKTFQGIKNLSIFELNVPNILIRLMKEYLLLPWLLWVEEVDLLYAPANIAPLFCPCRTVVQIINIDPFIKRKGLPFFQLIRRLLLRALSFLAVKRADKVVFNCSYSEDLICNRFGIDRNKATQINFGADHLSMRKAARPPIKNKYILSVSNIYPYKNFKTLIQAYSRLDKKIRDEFHLVIVGSYTRETRKHFGELIKLTEALHVQTNVKFLGALEGDALIGAYQGASLFVLPSLIENFCFTPLEAMNASVPVLASNATGIPDSVGNAGIFFDPNKVDDLAGKMAQIISDCGLREQLILKGHHQIAGFNWREIAGQILELFEELQNASCGL